ncbi:MAG TPA: PepSY-associated TM helix domain-containing protein [Candidatus Kapabacteria bacterium]|nr:PepSY-associated TM helix domain-containing protein [Candidatus Kapabacteria bacterium]
MELNNKNIYKLNKNLHRDLGYFFFFLTIIYCISGIAINHHHDWNPDFVVNKKEFKINLPNTSSQINEKMVLSELDRLDENYKYLMYDSPTPEKLKIYFKDGFMFVDLTSGHAEMERVNKRALLFEMNWLHRNPGGLWTIVSDIFALCLILISVTGLFILKGKNSLKGRGKWLVGSGVASTIILFFILVL